MLLPAAVAAAQATNQDIVMPPGARVRGSFESATPPLGRPVDVVLTNGVHVPGTIVESGPDFVIVRTPNGVVRIPRARVRTITARRPSQSTPTAAPTSGTHTADTSTPLLGLSGPQLPHLGAPAGLALLGQHNVNQSLSFGVMPILPIGVFANVSYHARITPATTIGASVVHMESFFGRGGIASVTVSTHGAKSSFMAGLNGIYASGGYFQPAATGAFTRQLNARVSVAGIGTISAHGGTALGLVGVGKRPMRANIGAMVTRTVVGQLVVRPIVMFGLQF
jgi:hypothetical protein